MTDYQFQVVEKTREEVKRSDMKDTCINVRNLNKSFSGRKVVNDLTFTIKKGEVYGILGHNGAGKSTSIDLILGLKSPDSGSATILGMDASKHRKQVFERVGVQLQHTEYQSMMTVEDACSMYASLYSKPADLQFDHHTFLSTAAPLMSSSIRLILFIMSFISCCAALTSEAFDAASATPSRMSSVSSSFFFFFSLVASMRS